MPSASQIPWPDAVPNDFVAAPSKPARTSTENAKSNADMSNGHLRPGFAQSNLRSLSGPFLSKSWQGDEPHAAAPDLRQQLEDKNALHVNEEKEGDQEEEHEEKEDTHDDEDDEYTTEDETSDGQALSFEEARAKVYENRTREAHQGDSFLSTASPLLPSRQPDPGLLHSPISMSDSREGQGKFQSPRTFRGDGMGGREKFVYPSSSLPSDLSSGSLFTPNALTSVHKYTRQRPYSRNKSPLSSRPPPEPVLSMLTCVCECACDCAVSYSVEYLNRAWTPQRFSSPISQRLQTKRGKEDSKKRKARRS